MGRKLFSCAPHVSGSGAATLAGRVEYPGGELRGEQLLYFLNAPPLPHCFVLIAGQVGAAAVTGPQLLWPVCPLSDSPWGQIGFLLMKSSLEPLEQVPHLLSWFFLVFSPHAWPRPGQGPAQRLLPQRSNYRAHSLAPP